MGRRSNYTAKQDTRLPLHKAVEGNNGASSRTRDTGTPGATSSPPLAGRVGTAEKRPSAAVERLERMDASRGSQPPSRQRPTNG